MTLELPNADICKMNINTSEIIAKMIITLSQIDGPAKYIGIHFKSILQAYTFVKRQIVCLILSIQLFSLFL